VDFSGNRRTWSAPLQLAPSSFEGRRQLMMT
jgi:hypothetical protein